MQMLQSDWLSHFTLSALVCSASVWSTKLQCFLVSPNFEGTFFKQMDNQILRRPKGVHLHCTVS